MKGDKPLRIVAVIPARMASVRFPGKPLHCICNLPMIEHVRRRAELQSTIAEVVVATCDREVAEVVINGGGKVVMTSPSHPTGTDRAAEAIRHIDCTHVLVLQGDEPLILPDQLAAITTAIAENPEVEVWNAVGLLADETDLANRSVVKCVLSRSGRILFCSRDFSHLAGSLDRKCFIRKILGLIAFERGMLERFQEMASSPYEIAASIEQSRLLEHDVQLRSIEVQVSSQSVNDPTDVPLIEGAFDRDPVQRALLDRTLRNRGALDGSRL